MSKALVAAMAVSMMAPVGVMAKTSTGEDEQSTTVNYSASQEYEWTVPSTIEFTDTEKQQTGKIEVTKSIIPDGKMLCISLQSSENDFQVKQSKGEDAYGVNYMVRLGNASTGLTEGQTICRVHAGVNLELNPLPCELIFELTGNTKVSGEYTDTITYAAGIVDA